MLWQDVVRDSSISLLVIPGAHHSAYVQLLLGKICAFRLTIITCIAKIVVINEESLLINKANAFKGTRSFVSSGYFLNYTKIISFLSLIKMLRVKSSPAPLSSPPLTRAWVQRPWLYSILLTISRASATSCTVYARPRGHPTASYG